MRLALLALAILLSAPASAEPLAQGTAQDAAIAWIGGQVIPSDVVVQPRLTIPWPGGARVRLEAHAHGIPVVGWEQVLALDPRGAVRTVYGEPLPAVPVDLRGDIALERALAWGRSVAGWHGEGELWAPRAERRVLARDGGMRLIWQVEASAAQPPGAWRLWVDAQTGTLLSWFPTMHSVQGNVYPENPVNSIAGPVELEGLWADDALEGSYAIVHSCTDVDSEGMGGGTCVEKTDFAVPDATGDYLYPPDAGSFEDPFAEVNMYHHLDYIGRWFDERYSFAHPAPMEGLVNFETANAFFGDFDGDGVGEVSFGQTGDIDFAYDADVIYHEFMHSVFGHLVNPGFINADEFGLEWATGGLNEGSADVFSLVQSGDAQLGEYTGQVFGQGDRPIRDLEADRRCPLDLYGEVHRDGEVWGALAWNLVETIGAEATADVFYGAITTFPSDANWAFAGQALLDSAAELLEVGVITQGDHDAVVDEATRSGVAGCSRVNRLDEGDAPTQLLLNVGFFPDSRLPLGQQFSLDAPEGATALRLRVDSLATGEPNLGWVLQGRRGEHVRHDLVPIDTVFGTLDIPIAADFDFEIEGEGGDWEVELTVDSDPALVPGATYYFAVASRQLGKIQGFGTGDITVSGEVDIEPVVAADDDDTAGDDDDDGGDGCSSCSTAGGGGSLAVLLLLGLGRRRRS